MSLTDMTFWLEQNDSAHLTCGNAVIQALINTDLGMGLVHMLIIMKILVLFYVLHFVIFERLVVHSECFETL